MDSKKETLPLDRLHGFRFGADILDPVDNYYGVSRYRLKMGITVYGMAFKVGTVLCFNEKGYLSSGILAEDYKVFDVLIPKDSEVTVIIRNDVLYVIVANCPTEQPFEGKFSSLNWQGINGLFESKTLAIDAVVDGVFVKAGFTLQYDEHGKPRQVLDWRGYHFE